MNNEQFMRNYCSLEGIADKYTFHLAQMMPLAIVWALLHPKNVVKASKWPWKFQTQKIVEKLPKWKIVL
jgi:hypothetical protein